MNTEQARSDRKEEEGCTRKRICTRKIVREKILYQKVWSEGCARKRICTRKIVREKNCTRKSGKFCTRKILYQEKSGTEGIGIRRKDGSQPPPTPYP
jgi:hypothetical protein